MIIISCYNSQKRNVLIAFTIVFLFLLKPAMAQPPSAFTYPSPVAYIANVSNVFISPTVSGTVTRYTLSDSPALPAGLTFNPNTGVISGVPTEALPATVYTVTASNEAGSVSTRFTMTVTNNYLNNNNNQVHFGGTGVTISHPNGSSTGQSAGDITLYQNVATISGQSIDCIITTKAVNNVSSWIIYDQPDASGNAFNSNSPDFFSPQLSFGTGGGYVSYEFQFIFGGTYNATTRTGQNVVLQNVKLNTYDIDGNGTADAFQYNEFSGFSTSELGSSPTVQAVYNNETGLTRFISTTATNSQTVTAAATRVRVSYANMSNFSIVVGSRGPGTALFFLDFSVGPTFTSVTTSSPSVDLNTSVVGVANEGAGCAGSLSLTRPSQTNITAPTTLTGLEVSYPASDIRDGAAELLTVAGATGSSVLPLGFNAGSSGTVTLGGVTFNFTKSVSATSGVTTNKIAFTRSTGGTTFTSAEAENLLDALQYSNSAATPTVGERRLSVVVYNSVFKSPSAVFSANVNCVTLAGHIYKDQNGLLGTTDFNTISANSATGQFAQGAAYAVVVNPSTNQVIEAEPIAAGGAFNFGTVTPGSYFLYVSATNPAPGTVFTQATFPPNYISVGENLSAAPGSDLLNDGKLIVTVGTTPVTNANFGLNSPPSANPLNAAAMQNPGGTQRVVVPSLSGSDPEQGVLADGNGNGIVIATFPANARLYYNNVEITPESTPIQNYQPALLTIDPDNGELTASFTYRQVDAAGFTSEPAPVNIPFTDLTIGGRLFHDVNGIENNTIDGDVISAVDQTQLYANLVLRANRMVAGSVPIVDGAFTLGTGNGLQANTPFLVVLSTIQGIAGTSVGATPLLPAGWQNTAEGSGTGDGSPNGIFELDAASGTTPEIRFGIQMPPVAYPVNAAAQVNPGGTRRLPVPALNGMDPEDGVLDGTVREGIPGNRVRITSFPTNATLYYRDVALDSTNAFITGYDASLLTVDPDNGAITITFTYQEGDQGGLFSDDALVTLPITDLSLQGTVYHDPNGVSDADINGQVLGDNLNAALFVNLLDTSNQVLGSVPVTSGTYTLGTAAGLATDTEFRLVLSTVEGIAGTAVGASALLPDGWAYTAEGSGPGDAAADGYLAFTMGSESLTTGADFGVEQLPTAGAGSSEARNEPGQIFITVPASTFSNGTASTDPDGEVTHVRITAFPAGAAAIRINGVTYQADVAADTEELLSLTLPADAQGSPSATIAVDPVLNNETQVDIPFVVIDNAGEPSPNTGHAVMNLTVPLPVTLIAFDAQAEGRTASLRWTTTEETNSDLFEIQHSTDAKSWVTVGRVRAAGTSQQVLQYQFTHTEVAAGNNYYRLRMVDQDGSAALSSMKVIDFGEDMQVQVYPNPTRDYITIQLENWANVTQVSVLDSRSNEIFRSGLKPANRIDLRNYGSGIYLIKIHQANGSVITRKLVVQ